MTHHLLGLNRDFMKDTVNVILTRDPVEMLPSFAKVIPNPTIADVGYEMHIELLHHFKKFNIPFVVLDGMNTLLNPKKVLSELCRIIDIPFEEKMLSWAPQARPEDGIWAKYWYHNVHQSTSFIKYEAKTAPFPEYLKPLLDQCLPFYKQLQPLVLK